MIRGLIVDDAPYVRKGIHLLLQSEPDIEIAGEAADGPAAVDAILDLKPDLLFLDIQMPGFGGFEVIERTRHFQPKALIFITAYDDYALKAFDVQAVGYILKPIVPERFRSALQRARQVLAGADAPGRTAAGESELPAQSPADVSSVKSPLARLLVRHRSRYILLKTGEIDWVAAVGEYVNLHAGGKAYMAHMAISELESRLDRDQFARIHRSTMVNLDRIKEIVTLSHGDCEVLLQDGTALRMSRSFRNRLFSGETAG